MSVRIETLCFFMVDIAVVFVHAYPERDLVTKAPAGITTSLWWRPHAATDGPWKASRHWQEVGCSSPAVDEVPKKHAQPEYFFKTCWVKRMLSNSDVVHLGTREKLLELKEQISTMPTSLLRRRTRERDTSARGTSL